MGLLTGLLLGGGLLLVWLALTEPSTGPRVRRTGSRRPGLRTRLAEAGLDGVTPASFVAASAVLGVVGLVVMLVVSRTVPVALVFGALAAYLPRGWLAGRARRRQRELTEVWPEAVDHLASGVRAGLSLPEAIAALSIRGPEPLQGAFAAFAVDHQATGRFSESLDRLKERLADPVGDRVVESLRIAREVGSGDLGRLLRNLSAFLREDARTRSELEARQSWTVNGARLAVSAPWLVLLLLSLQPEVVGRYASPAGVVVLAGGAGLCVVAYRTMMRIGRLPLERRVLR